MSQLNVDNIRNRTGSNGGPNFPSGITVAVGQTAYIHGNLQVDGTETIINTETLNVSDKTVGIGSTSNASNTTADGSGIEIFASSSQTGNNKTITWSNTSNSWEFGPNDVGLKVGTGITVYGETGIVSATSFKGDGSQLTGIDATAIQTGNTSVQTVDTGSDGHVKMTTEGGERVRVGPAGQIGLGGANYGTSGQVITSAGSGSAPTWSAIPAGGNVIVAEAEGSIAADKCVKIRTDGKVEQIKSTVTERTTQEDSLTSPSVPSNFGSVGGGRRASASSGIAWSTTQQVGYWVYKEAQASPYKLRIQAYDWRGSNNAFQYYADEAMTNYRVEMPKAVWDSTNDKIVVAWKRDSDDNARFSYVTPSSSAGTRLTMSGNDNELYGASMDMLQMCYVGNGRCMACWKRSSVNDAQVRILSWDSGTSDYVKTTDYNSSNSNISDPDVAYDASGDRVILVYIDNANNAYGRIKVGQITGTGTSANPNFGSEITFSTATCDKPRVLVDATTGKVIVTFYNIDTGTYYGVVGTLSGTNSITMGTPVELDSYAGRSDWTDTGYLTYMASQNCVYAHYIARRNGGGTNYFVKSAKLTTSSSDNSLTISNILFISASQNILSGMACAAVLPDTVENKIMLFGRNDGNSELAAYKYQRITAATTNLTDGNHYLGFADQAYTDGQTATIKTVGNTATTLSGLTAGTKYYVQNDGTLATTTQTPTALAGLAIAPTKLLIREPKADV